jgi:adenylosuccinate synthase
MYDHEGLSVESVIDEITSYQYIYDEYCKDTQELLFDWIKSDKKILFEGAQGTLLDIDQGTYPYVTSSSTTAGGVSTGLGVGPRYIDEIIGITKAYTTRVGEGPFITELFDDDGEMLAKNGHEFGATTGRPRRCGWLDLVALRKAVFTNSVTDLCLTKLDVLDTFDEIQVCVEYKNDQPIYKSFSGWDNKTEGVTKYDSLPINAKSYIEFIEKFVDTKISIISTGPSRDQTITR